MLSHLPALGIERWREQWEANAQPPEQTGQTQNGGSHDKTVQLCFNFVVTGTLRIAYAHQCSSVCSSKMWLQSLNLATGPVSQASKLSVRPGNFPRIHVSLISRNSEETVYCDNAIAQVSQIQYGLNPQ